jgi:SPX domain protein involved in polyphosphate accumulation
MENLSKIGQEIIEICKFVELNLTAIRKILKKFDKQFKSFSMYHSIKELTVIFI